MPPSIALPASAAQAIVYFYLSAGDTFGKQESRQFRQIFINPFQVAGLNIRFLPNMDAGKPLPWHQHNVVGAPREGFKGVM